MGLTPLPDADLDDLDKILTAASLLESRSTIRKNRVEELVSAATEGREVLGDLFGEARFSDDRGDLLPGFFAPLIIRMKKALTG
jgi:hypothetical protein